MDNENICTAAERMDVKEVLSLVDRSVGQFASAAASFADVATIFEAIAAAAPTHSLTSRLANLGITLCERHECDFAEQQITYEAHLDRYDLAFQPGTGERND